MFSLSACDNTIFHGPASIQRNGTRLRIAVCADVEEQNAYASERNQASDVPWHRFWEVRGSAHLTEGTIISPTVEIAGLVGSLQGDPSLDPGSDIAITLNSVKTTGGVLAEFYVDSAGLSESTWLHPDGSKTAEPCPADK
jgi:hypothetical protein